MDIIVLQYSIVLIVLLDGRHNYYYTIKVLQCEVCVASLLLRALARREYIMYCTRYRMSCASRPCILKPAFLICASFGHCWKLLGHFSRLFIIRAVFNTNHCTFCCNFLGVFSHQTDEQTHRHTPCLNRNGKTFGTLLFLYYLTRIYCTLCLGANARRNHCIQNSIAVHQKLGSCLIVLHLHLVFFIAKLTYAKVR